MPRRDDLHQRARGPRSVVAVSLERRRLCRWLVVPASQLLVPAAWGIPGRIASARLWPAQEYTRLILESATPIAHQLIVLRDPPRIVLDLEGLASTPELDQLPGRVQDTDPYIAGIRIGRKSPESLRLVLDLKVETKPQLFALKPVAEFGHRVVLDLYPLTPIDPLMALLDSLPERASGSTAAPDVPATAPERPLSQRPDIRARAR